MDIHSTRAAKEGVSRNEAKARSFAENYGANDASPFLTREFYNQLVDVTVLSQEEEKQCNKTGRFLTRTQPAKLLGKLAATKDYQLYKAKQAVRRLQQELRLQKEQFEKNRVEIVYRQKEDSKIELAKALAQAIGSIATIVGEGGLAK